MILLFLSFNLCGGGGGLVTKLFLSDSCNPMACSPPGSSVHGILQARTLEWVAISFSRGSSWPRNQTQVSCTAGSLLPTELQGKSFNFVLAFKLIDPLSLLFYYIFAFTSEI